MDGSRFDQLTKELHAERSRRSLLGALAGAALGAVAAAAGLGDASAASRCRNLGISCSKDGDCCSKSCRRNQRTGRRTCAAPQNQCSSDIECPPGSGPCQAGVCNAGVCGIGEPDYQNDVNNCGGCGVVCLVPDNGQPTCAQGMCGVTCNEGAANCFDECVDVQTDVNNCGACGNTCSTGQTCCGGACVDQESDTDNCGACGNICRVGETCSAGVCMCGTGDRCDARFACVDGVCTDACEADPTTKCTVDCSGGEPSLCFAGPEQAFCDNGASSVGCTRCNRDADCPSGHCVARLYGSSITDVNTDNCGLEATTGVCFYPGNGNTCGPN